MFDNLSDRLNKSLKNIRGQGRLTEDNVKATLREVRMALLEADVALPVVKRFVDDIRTRAMGTEVTDSLTPGQSLVKIVQQELVKVLGEGEGGLNLRAQPPVIVLMAGLQGSGKTTSVAKLARHLRERERKQVLVVSCDIYRPAAIDQLHTLADEVGVEWFPSTPQQKPGDIARDAVQHARRRYHDVVLVDTAGRLAIDQEMMREIGNLHSVLTPTETLFVVDAMTGQDAAQTAKAFGEAVPLTGVVLTKVDGDSRGGAALSVRYVTERPIKFLGVGEKTDALEVFHPDRIASRILGMGDVLTLIEDAERNLDQKKAQRLAKKLKKGKGFNLNDFSDQLKQMQQMGGVGSMLERLPGGAKVPDAVKAQADDSQVTRMLAMVNSMTEQERRHPDVIRASRKRRIAAGSGVQVQDVNRMLRQFTQMQKMMKKMAKGGMQKMMRAMGGRMPPGMGMR